MLLFSLKDTEVVIDKSWREHNTIRPHRSIKGGLQAPEAILPFGFQQSLVIRNS